MACALGLAAAPARADVACTWMAVAGHVLDKAWMQGPGTWRTEKTTRAGAQVAIAVFEAANAVDRRYTSYLGLAPAPPGASAEAAVATAAHTVLLSLLPDQKSTLDDALLVSLAQVPDGAAETAGIAIGKQAAAAAMARATLPAGTAVSPYRPLTATGTYIDPGLPGIQPFDLAMPPFVLQSASEFRPAAPPALTSATYGRDLEEVRRLGAKKSADRPADKTLLADVYLQIRTWPIVERFACHAGQRLVDTARLFALVEIAMEDTWLAVMDAKMHYTTWRPITAIRNADRDGNEATTHDAAWTPLLRTPTHPDYPCGHCGNAAAFATVLETVTGPAPAGGITVPSYVANPGLQVRIPTWQQFVEEMSMSRIYAGAHTRTANDVAEAMGRAIATRVLTTVMQPLPQTAAR